jgi:curved DNA-binding protein CbpA
MCGPGNTCHYHVLGLTISVKGAEIETAYRKAIIQVHPDKLVKASEAKKVEGEAKVKLLKAAWGRLGDKRSHALSNKHCTRIPIEEYRFAPQSTRLTAPAPDLSCFYKPTPDSPPKSTQPTYGDMDAPEPDFSRSKRSRSFYDSQDEDDQTQSAPPPPKRRRATLKAKAAPKPNKPEAERGENTYEYNANGWTFSIKGQPKIPRV